MGRYFAKVQRGKVQRDVPKLERSKCGMFQSWNVHLAKVGYSKGGMSQR